MKKIRRSVSELYNYYQKFYKSLTVEIRIFNKLKKFISISLVFVILFSQFGLAVGTHYCEGLFVKTKLMIGHAHLDCDDMSMGDMAKDCDRKSGPETHLDKKSCCENEYLSIDVENEFKLSIEQRAINLDFVAILAISYIDLFSADQEKPQYSAYNPPLVTKDISILHQVFLI